MCNNVVGMAVIKTSGLAMAGFVVPTKPRVTNVHRMTLQAAHAGGGVSTHPLVLAAPPKAQEGEESTIAVLSVTVKIGDLITTAFVKMCLAPKIVRNLLILPGIHVIPGIGTPMQIQEI